MATWGQLGYASTKGGFGVHAETGLDHDERDLLIAGCNPGRKSFGVELPLLADASQVARFPRNLSYRWVPEVGGCYWHSSPAGADESGRTGNVFVHALIDRGQDGALPARRPVEVWRSPTMLIPFGIAEVTAATLPPLPPEPSAVVTREHVVRFLTSFEVDRISMLTQVLPALAEKRTMPLVLGVGTPDEGALWVAAISYLLSPGAARELSFVVWETPDLLTADRLPAVELICVQESQIPPTLVDELGLQVISSAAQPVEPAGELARAWGELAEHLFSQAQEEIVGLLEQVDQISAESSVGSAPRAWPLAMAMACSLEQWPHLQDQLTSMLLQLTPARIGQGRLWQVTERLIKERKDRSDTDLADLLADVRAAAPGPTQAMLHQGYVERAIGQPQWVADPARRTGSLRSKGSAKGGGQPRVTLAGTWEDRWVQQALSAGAADDPVDRALQLTWLVDFLLAEGWEAGGPPEAELAVGGIFHPVPTVLGAQAESEEFLARLGSVSPDTELLLIHPSATRALHEAAGPDGAPAGQRLTPELVERLVPLTLILEQGLLAEIDQVLLEEAVVHYLHTPSAPDLTSLVVGALTHEGQLTGIIDHLIQALPHLDLSAHQMGAILRGHRLSVPLLAVARSLAYGADDGLRDLAVELGLRARSRQHDPWVRWRAENPDLCHAVQTLQVLVRDPVTFLKEANSRGAAEMTRVRDQFFNLQDGVKQFHDEGSGLDPLPQTWMDFFDLVCSVSDLTHWRTDRQSLFGTDGGARESAAFFERILLSEPLAGGRDVKWRETLVTRIVFNAWFSALWPAKLGKDRSDRVRPVESPAHHFVELLMSSEQGPAVDHLLEPLLADVARVTAAERGYGPDLPGQDIDVLEKKAEDWFWRASGQTLGKKLGSLFGRRKS